jgi:uncharacterized membrane protein
MATFIDDLALIEILLALVAAIFAYGGVLIWWAIRQNDPKGVRGILRGVSVPLGLSGGVALLLALWGEMTWPFLASDKLAGYNIFFFDPLVLLGLVLVAYAISIQLSAKLQYVGLFGLIAGGATAFYGWTGYTASPAFTKDPFDTLLLYSGFAAAGIFAFPATIVLDYFLGAADSGKQPFGFAQGRVRSARIRFGTRAAQPVVPGGASASPASPASAPASYTVPAWVQLILLLFPVFVGLAAIAAFWYFGTTLPGHLGAGAGAAP